MIDYYNPKCLNLFIFFSFFAAHLQQKAQRPGGRQTSEAQIQPLQQAAAQLQLSSSNALFINFVIKRFHQEMLMCQGSAV